MALSRLRAAVGSSLLFVFFTACSGPGGQTPPTALLPASAHRSPHGTITEFGGTLDQPYGIASGPGYNLWFTESGGIHDGKIAYISTDGAITEVATGLAQPTGIAAGPHDQIWFTELNGTGEVTPRGVVTQYPYPSLLSIVLGPDGNFWYGSDGLSLKHNSQLAVNIVKMTPSGVATSYNDDTPANPIGDFILPGGFSAGDDGNLWFTAYQLGVLSGNAYVCKITTAGVITKYLVPASTTSTLTTPGQTASGPGGVWFTLAGDVTTADGSIGKLSPDGTVTEYGGHLALPSGITRGPDGAMWFTEGGIWAGSTATYSGRIGRIAADGTITEYGSNLSNPTQIAVGPDGNLWFTEHGFGRFGGKIGRIVP
jgi:virginiamycin B lyase